MAGNRRVAEAWAASAGRIMGVPMRQDCKFFESRSYRSGETVRKCDLNLAPEAPWRCPDDCPAYERRLADVNWQYGTLVTPETPAEPSSLDSEDAAVADLLAEAKRIVNEAGPAVLADVSNERSKRPGFVKRLFKRRRRR